MNAPAVPGVGTFDPQSFMDASIAEANSTEYIPVPVGEYPAMSADVQIRPWQGSKDPSQSGLALDILWEIEDEAVKQLLSRPKVTVKQGIMLDLTEAGSLDMGKGRNVNLGKLREALGLNVPGAPFSFRMLQGRRAKVKVEHKSVNNAPIANVTAVTKP